MPDKATFYGAFDGNVSVTLTIDYEVFQKTPQLNWMNAEWVGEPGQLALSQWRSWMHTVMSQVAQRVNQQVLLALGAPGAPITTRTPVFRYHPDGRTEQVQIPFH
jgi:hypothetical protein